MLYKNRAAWPPFYSIHSLDQSNDTKKSPQLPTGTQRNTARRLRTRSQLKPIRNMVLLLQPSNRIARLPKPVLIDMNIVVHAGGPAFYLYRMRLTPVVAAVVGFLYGPFAAVLLQSRCDVWLAAGDGAEEGFAVVGEACDP